MRSSLESRVWSLLAPWAAVALVACADAAPGADPLPAQDEGLVTLTDAQVGAAGIRWEPVTSSDVRQTVRVPGSVGAPDTARAVVGSILEGRVARLRVLPGDRVRAGQTLIDIHGHELFDAQADLVSAEAVAEVARAAAARGERLHEAGAIALEDLERRRAELATAEAEVARAEEMVEHLHPTPAGNASAVAPVAGTVFSVEVATGEVVLPGTPLVHMGTTDQLWVTAFVPEGTSASLGRGDEVTVQFQAAPGVDARARLVQVGQYVNPDNRSVEMRFEILDPPPAVRPGSFATVLVSTTSTVQGVELPESAVVRIGDGDAVFVALGDGRFEPLMVSALALGDGRLVVEGLTAGTEVVVDGAYFLKSALEGGEEGGGEG